MRDNFLKEYIDFGRQIGIRNFIIQSLESKTGTNVPFIEEYFKEFEEYLKSQDFDKRQIVSSAYYDLSLFTKGDYSVALKTYFNSSELDKHFRYCPKHSFDLGIDSNGDIYTDFQMIKKLKK